MGAFKSAIITKKGQALLAKVVAGNTKLVFTKIAVGDSPLSGDIASKTGIGTIRQSTAVASVVRQNDSNVKVSASFSNSALTAGYYVRNIGLYATDPQEGEICYSISVADESEATADWMPPFNGIGVSSLLVDLVTAVSNASKVTVEVDPAAMATVAQIVDLQAQIDDVRTFIGYESSDVYGVEVDFVNRKFKRLAGAEHFTAGADFDGLAPWMRKRCILADDGVVLAYRGETGYTETGATSQAITKTVDGAEKVYPAGTKVQVMVEQPLFYVKAVPVGAKAATSGRGKQYTKARYYISATPKAGFTPMRGFQDANGVTQDRIYLSAFEGCIYDESAGKYLMADEQSADFATDKLSSIAGAKPASGLTQNLTRANTRKLANNRGTGWQLHNIFSLSATQWLILIEYATFDCQTVIGKGVCNFTDDGKTNMAVVTGATSGLGNGSGIDPNGGVNGKCSVSYRGEENLWGNIWTWLDAINVHNNLAAGESGIYLKAYGTYADDTDKDYKRIAFDPKTQSGYQSALGIDPEYPELSLPTECSGSSNLPIGAYWWNNYDGWRVAGLGGMWHYGAYCSAWYLGLSGTSSYRYRSIGGRLLYVPQSKIAIAAA